jgi:hypothetical protein
MAFLALFAVLLMSNAVDGSGTGTVTKPPAGVTARARLTITRFVPLTVVGRGFKPDERVTVSTDSARKRVVANRAGVFNVRFATSGRCNSTTVVALGSKGSRAVVNFAQLLCVSP